MKNMRHDYIAYIYIYVYMWVMRGVDRTLPAHIFILLSLIA